MNMAARISELPVDKLTDELITTIDAGDIPEFKPKKAERKIGGRWYYSGGNLRRPDVRALDLDFDAAYGEAGSGFEIGSLGVTCCSLEG